MRTELLSTSHPSPLRLVGFISLVIGAALAGIGATMTWATIGFPGDTAGSADVVAHGTDGWEGIVVLGIAIMALVAALAMRVSASRTTRSLFAAAVALGGGVVVALTVLDLATATDRFGGTGGLADIARSIADRLGQPVDRVRALLARSFGATLRVDVGAGLALSLVGGLLLVVAGAVSLAWGRRSAPDDPETVPPPVEP